MPEAVFDRFGSKDVVVVDAIATDHVQIDFDLESARLYLLGGDLIARTITDRLIILAGFKDAVSQRPAMQVSTIGGPTVTGEHLIARAAPLQSVVELFDRAKPDPSVRPSEG